VSGAAVDSSLARPRARLDRAIWAALALASLLVLVVASLLSPSTSGVGTHVALGLPPCGFLLWSGLPCPACGLTTSFAHLARAELAPALAANPLGLPLFALTVTLVPFASLHTYKGTSFVHEIERLRADRAALILVLALLLAWAARLAALLGPTGPTP
jgi:hypothetical protein